MFIEASPAPVKFALSHKGRMSASVRLPLLAASETARPKILDALRRYEGGL
jgi:4-hydroxy-tetrahydrodipicolinate synthase